MKSNILKRLKGCNAFALLRKGGMGACLFALALSFTSCSDHHWDESEKTAEQARIGNSNIAETNVVTIAQLKEKYKTAINTNYGYKQVDGYMQIKGYVTANDASGNLYNEFVIDDGTGAISVAVSKGGLYGTLPVGAEVLIELNELYVGNYGMHAEIGTPYTNGSGKTYVSRMNPFTWSQHFKLTGKNGIVEPVDFDSSWKPAADGMAYSGKLVTIKNVSFKGADGKKTFANAGSGSGSISTLFNELPQSTMLYTSNFADFASNTLPQGKVDVTGILKRYNNYWEIIIRNLTDIKPASGK